MKSYERLGFKSYAAYLKSEHWGNFKKRYRASKAHPQNCRVCDTSGPDLHHVTYERLGAERLDDVMPLCDWHHRKVHEWLKEHYAPVERTPEALTVLLAEFGPRPQQVAQQPKKDRKGKAARRRARNIEQNRKSEAQKKWDAIREAKIAAARQSNRNFTPNPLAVGNLAITAHLRAIGGGVKANRMAKRNKGKWNKRLNPTFPSTSSTPVPQSS